MIMKKCLSMCLVLIFIGSCSTSNKRTVDHKIFKLHPLSIVQGSTNATETYISVMYKKSDETELSYFYSEVAPPPSEPLEGAQKTQEMSTVSDKTPVEKNIISIFKKPSPDKNYVIEHLHIEGLKPETLYRLSVKTSDGGDTVDERTFKSLNLNKKNARVGLASCMDDRFSDVSDRMWTSYLNKFLDVSFFIGDNVYADKKANTFINQATPDILWQRYIKTFDRLYIYHASELIPTFALWDDHDYGVNNGGADYKFKNESLKIFKIFFPQYDLKGFNLSEFGAGSVLKAFGQKFMFIDGRFYREKEKTGSHLGKEQKDFLLKQIKNAKSPTWLIKGDQFFGGYHPFESYQSDHPNEFKKFLGDIKRLKYKRPLIFVSGDRHLTEIINVPESHIGYKTYEITSSGIHAKVFKDSLKKHPSPHQWVGKDGVYNYTVIEISDSKTKGKQNYQVTSYGEKNWSHYSRKLEF